QRKLRRQRKFGCSGAPKQLLDGPTLHQLEAEKVESPCLPQIKHLDDVAVVEAHCHVRLVEQQIPEAWRGQVGADALEHHQLLETMGTRELRKEDLGHP